MLGFLTGFLFVGDGKLHVKHTGLTTGGILAITYIILLFFCIGIVKLLLIEGVSCPFGYAELASNMWLFSGGFFLAFIIGTIIGTLAAYLYNIIHPGRSSRKR